MAIPETSMKITGVWISISRMRWFFLAGAFSVCCLLGARWERRLPVFTQDGTLLHAQASGGEWPESPGHAEDGTFQRIEQDEGTFQAQYGFINFNRDRLSVRFRIAKKDFWDYVEGYGYTDREIGQVHLWHKNALQKAYQSALELGYAQAQLDLVSKGLEKEYQTRLREYLSSRGFVLRPGNVAEADIPGTVRRNSSYLKSLALTFENIAAERGYGSEDIVGAVTSMVQTSIRYRIPPSLEGGRHTGGILPPLKSLVLGWGDCDTKTGLLASILSNWDQIRMVGIAVPGHYLMGILRSPNKGDWFIEYKGLQYVLIEPAGPAWLEPGSIGDDTGPLLESDQGYRIEPFS